MNSYQIEQLKTLHTVRQNLEPAAGSSADCGQWDGKEEIHRYMAFRDRTAIFHQRHFEEVCTEKCYHSRLSACCSRDGIIIFFADVVINALYSSYSELDLLEHAIQYPAASEKCIFLSSSGCLWRVKPIVCEMFVCEPALKQVFTKNPDAEAQWRQLEQERKSYTWPDKPVLFEHLERRFLDMGIDSSLMHIHKSPGLLRIRGVKP